MITHRARLGLTVVLSLTVAASSLWAGSRGGHPVVAQESRPSTPARRDAPTAAEIARVERFVEANLVQLQPLLRYLKKHAETEYYKAIDDLGKAINRIEGVHRRDPVLANIDLELLRAQTQIDMNLARLRQADRPAVRRQLREALIARERARVKRMEHQIDTLNERVEQLNQQLAKLQGALQETESTHDEKVEAELKSMIRRAESARRKNQNSQDE